MRDAVRAYMIDRGIDPPDWANHADLLNAFQRYGVR